MGFSKKNRAATFQGHGSQHALLGAHCNGKLFGSIKEQLFVHFHSEHHILIHSPCVFPTAWSTPPIDANAAPKEPHGQGKVGAPEGQAFSEVV